jgi:hypothetical protein
MPLIVLYFEKEISRKRRCIVIVVKKEGKVENLE